MAVFMVGYDLHEGEDYENLITAIKTYPWWHCLDSTWLIKSTKTAAQIRDHLQRHIKPDDRLLVMRYGNTEHGVGANAAWYGFNQECNDWLKQNL
jgi:hypothetical protein